MGFLPRLMKIYLENALNDINEMWQGSFNQIQKVNYLMIAEPPCGELGRNIFTIRNPITLNFFIVKIWATFRIDI